MSVTVGVLPKSTRRQYFDECRAGAEDAARELRFALRWEGPRHPSAADYPGVKLAEVRECHDVEEQARQPASRAARSGRRAAMARDS
jgi:hypothetical protein